MTRVREALLQAEAVAGASGSGAPAARPLRTRSRSAASAATGTASLPIRDSASPKAPRLAVRWDSIDQALIAMTVGLVCLGLVMVYSASIALPDSNKYENYAPTHFLVRHAMAMAIGLVAALLTVRIPISVWEKYAPHMFVAALVLLVLVLIPGIGRVVNKSRRWIPLGFMNFQPSEFAKLAIAMYAASYMVRKMDLKERFFKAVWPMVVAVGVAGVLLKLEPDMGAFIVTATIAMGILFLGGVNARMFFLMAGLIVFLLALNLTMDDMRRGRILAFFDPWNPTYAQAQAYQLTHSLIAFGRGELLGQGLGSSLEKLHYLPEAHTDFLLAVIGEELGFLGVAAVLIGFFWLTRRIVMIGRQCILLDRVFAGLLVQGIGVWFGAQALINMGVNLGALPTKGLTLPLLSYGGSAILLNLIAIAIVVRADAENRALMRGGRA